MKCEDCKFYKGWTGHGECELHGLDVWPVSVCSNFTAPIRYKVIGVLENGQETPYGTHDSKGLADHMAKALGYQKRFTKIKVVEV